MKSLLRVITVLSVFLGSSVRPSPAIGLESRTTVTAYSSGVGLVSEVRTLTLTRGVMEYVFSDVAALIEPDSVQIRSLPHPGTVKVLEQRFRHDLTGTDRLLHRSLGQTIVVTTREGDTCSGVLVSNQGGETVLRLEDRSLRVVKSQAIETFQFPPLQGLAESPTLTWLVESSRSGPQDIEVQYLTEGIRWSADYNAVVNREGNGLELSGWATVENRSGASYRDAKLRLLAGDVRRVSPLPIRPQRVFQAEARSAKAAQDIMEQSPVFEYHLYKLGRPVTLTDQEDVNLPLLTPVRVKAEKTFHYDGQRDDKNVRVNMEFRNDKAAGLGKPLPGGRVRVYKTDEDDSLSFVGEDEIRHTPEGEEVRLYLGSAFDLVGERTVKETLQVSKRSRRETVEIRLRNHKKDAVKVTVIEHLHGSWKFVSDTPPVTKKDADRVEFQVRVSGKDEKVFQYQVLYTW